MEVQQRCWYILEPMLTFELIWNFPIILLCLCPLLDNFLHTLLDVAEVANLRLCLDASLDHARNGIVEQLFGVGTLKNT